MITCICPDSALSRIQNPLISVKLFIYLGPNEECVCWDGRRPGRGAFLQLFALHGLGRNQCITLCKWEVKSTITSDKVIMLKDGLGFCNTKVLMLGLDNERNLANVTGNISGERQSSKWILSQSILLHIHFFFNVSSEESKPQVKNPGR